jgi:hypothetical protein
MKPGHGYSLLFRKKNVESFRCKVVGMMLKKCFFRKKKHGDSYNITNVITLPGWWSGT